MADRLTEAQKDLEAAVRAVCKDFPGEYWRELDRKREYPEEFVRTLTELGYLSVLIPEEYGGGGLGIAEAAAILEEIHRSGGNGGACHALLYTMGALVRHASAALKARVLPEIAAGRLRLQAFAVTEPDAGSDTTRIKTFARRKGDGYIVNGAKVFTSRVAQSDLMILLARTAPYEAVERKTDGISLLLVDLRQAVGQGLEFTPIDIMFNQQTNTVFFSDLEVAAENLIGVEGEGFRELLDGLNAERILLASEAIGDGRWFVEKAAKYASEREVFGRKIGENQGVQLPLAQCHAELEAASLMRWEAARLFDAGEACGAEANMAKLLASQASWRAANVCLNTHGGYGFAADYDVERKFRETKLFEVAPVNNNLILAYIGQHVLGMPRSY
jgi:acyl-CoA dehydrogenase